MKHAGAEHLCLPGHVTFIFVFCLYHRFACGTNTHLYCCHEVVCAAAGPYTRGGCGEPDRARWLCTTAQLLQDRRVVYPEVVALWYIATVFVSSATSLQMKDYFNRLMASLIGKTACGDHFHSATKSVPVNYERVSAGICPIMNKLCQIGGQ